MGDKLNWINKNIINELILRTHDGFLGRITDSIVGILIKNEIRGRVELVIVLDENFDNYQSSIIYDEVLPDLRELYSDMGIFEIDFQSYKEYTTISSFREVMPIKLSTYWPIYYRHEKMSDDGSLL